MTSGGGGGGGDEEEDNSDDENAEEYESAEEMESEDDELATEGTGVCLLASFKTGGSSKGLGIRKEGEEAEEVHSESVRSELGRIEDNFDGVEAALEIAEADGGPKRKDDGIAEAASAIEEEKDRTLSFDVVKLSERLLSLS